jgi:hypothetical protein
MKSVLVESASQKAILFARALNKRWSKYILWPSYPYDINVAVKSIISPSRTLDNFVYARFHNPTTLRSPRSRAAETHAPRPGLFFWQGSVPCGGESGDMPIRPSPLIHGAPVEKLR